MHNELQSFYFLSCTVCVTTRCFIIGVSSTNVTSRKLVAPSTKPFPDFFRMTTPKIKTTITSWQHVSRNMITYLVQLDFLAEISRRLKIPYRAAAKQTVRLTIAAVINGAKRTSIVTFFSPRSPEDFPTSREDCKFLHILRPATA